MRSSPPALDTIRVVIADDQELVRAGFRAILDAEEDLEAVGEAANGASVIELVRRLTPEVVLMDIRMPGVDGLEATRQVVRLPRPPRVLILTTFDLDEYLYEAMRAGASGFLLKDVTRHHLTAAVRIINAGETLLAPAITRRLIERFVSQDPLEPAGRKLEGLSGREIEVLQLIGRGRSNAEIAGDLFIGQSTVKTHVNHILGKLGLRDRAQAVIFAYESGLIHPGA